METIFNAHLNADTIFVEPETSTATSIAQVQNPTWKMVLQTSSNEAQVVDDSFPFDFGERLGTGGFGKVDKVRSLTSGKEYALKR